MEVNKCLVLHLCLKYPVNHRSTTMENQDKRTYRGKMSHQYRESKKHSHHTFWPIVLLRTGQVMSARVTLHTTG